MAGSTRSTPSPDSSASHRAPTRLQPQRDGHDGGQRHLHQRRAHRRRRRVVGGYDRRPARLTSSTGRASRGPPTETPAAHPNARFSVPASQCPSIAPEWEDPGRADLGVPLRRPPRHHRAAGVRVARVATRRVPRLDHGLREDCGRRRQDRRASLRSVRDAPVLRLQHRRLLRPLAEHGGAHRRGVAPERSRVNWFRKGDDGTFLWPGFGENSRVLEWICRRLDGDASGADTAIGVVPRPTTSRSTASTCPPTTSPPRSRSTTGVEARAPGIREHFADFGDRLPRELREQLDALEARLGLTGGTLGTRSPPPPPPETGGSE